MSLLIHIFIVSVTCNSMLLDEDSIHMCLIGYKQSSKGVNDYLKHGVVRSRLQTHERSYSTYNTLIPSYGGYFVTPLRTQ
jgi:hypothetical protein